MIEDREAFMKIDLEQEKREQLLLEAEKDPISFWKRIIKRLERDLKRDQYEKEKRTD